MSWRCIVFHPFSNKLSGAPGLSERQLDSEGTTNQSGRRLCRDLQSVLATLSRITLVCPCTPGPPRAYNLQCRAHNPSPQYFLFPTHPHAHVGKSKLDFVVALSFIMCYDIIAGAFGFYALLEEVTIFALPPSRSHSLLLGLQFHQFHLATRM